MNEETTPEKKPSFNIYTAIDILDKKCVRLEQGDYDLSTTYNQDPVFTAKRWNSKGAKWLHIVDLDGARLGHRANFAVIDDIMRATDLKIQVGGGIRKISSIEMYLEAGASRVVLGSVAVKDPDLVKTALEKFGDKIALALDCRKGIVAIEGWTQNSDMKAIDLVNQFTESGLKTVIYTDIEKDGMLTGPNIDELRAFSQSTQVNVIASGGVATIEDVYALKKLQQEAPNIDGVIIGKALYAKQIKAKDLYIDDIYF